MGLFNRKKQVGFVWRKTFTKPARYGLKKDKYNKVKIVWKKTHMKTKTLKVIWTIEK